VPGGSKNNLRWVEKKIRFDSAVSPIERLILADAQTSGGLLIAVPPEGVARLEAELEKNSTPVRALVGEVLEGEAGTLEVVAGESA
jgi:selenide,water dikinase